MGKESKKKVKADKSKGKIGFRAGVKYIGVRQASEGDTGLIYIKLATEHILPLEKHLRKVLAKGDGIYLEIHGVSDDTW